MKDADWMQGASDPDARLKDEVRASLVAWAEEYDQTRLDLAWTVAQMLLQHVGSTQPLAVHIEFLEKLAAILGDEATALRRVIEEDWKKRLN